MARTARARRLILTLAVSCVSLSLSSSRPEAQTTVPRFEKTPCDYPASPLTPTTTKRECGWLVVPESRAHPNGRTFRLAVLINHPQNPSDAPPLLLLHGGPGGEGTRFNWSEMTLPAVQRREVVIVDQRGAGESDPKTCPDFPTTAAPAFNLRTPKEREAAYREAARACVAKLKADGLDFSAFGADVNAADAIDLRHALGYQTWDIYGVSYGGFVAQEVLRRDAKAIRAAVLVSTASFSLDFAADVPLEFQRNLDHVFALCRQQPACHDAFPTVEQDFYELVDEFAKTPLQVPVAGSARVWLDNERFLREIKSEFGAPSSVRRLPLLIHELRRGDRERALTRLIGDGVMSPWDALGRLVQCNEYGNTYPAAVVTAKRKLRPPFQIIADDFREHCDLWFAAFTHPADRRPVVSDVPTLVVQGEFDQTGSERTFQAITKGLSHAYTYVLTGETHANPSFGCHGHLLEQFLDNPSRPPDASCLAQRSTPFRTAGFDPMLTIVVSPAAGAATPFSGTWEVTLGGGPDISLQLETDAETVRGNLVEPWGIPIENGHLQDGILRFSVKSVDGARTITFTGRLEGDEMHFTRDVAVAAGGNPGGPGLMGSLGPRALVAKRRR